VQHFSLVENGSANCLMPPSGPHFMPDDLHAGLFLNRDRHEASHSRQPADVRPAFESSVPHPPEGNLVLSGACIVVAP
jgi:hypothetical protein